uniref:Uncharacterized protein n=1 Tax=uncultured bacterium 66 TaxID=698391 RepID=E3T677_9BACT|nr:hypothetical protein [uncultured bacterium 66]
MHAEEARGTGMAAAGKLEGAHDQIALRFLERRVIVER